MMLRTQALVVGGGPAGSTAARFLAAHGIDTLLAERDFSFIKPCGGGIPSTVFSEVGIPEKPVRKHVHSLRVVSPRGETLDVALDGGSIAIVERGDFDHVLRIEAERAGARLLEAEFKRFENVGRTVTAQLALRRPPYGVTVHADYVIAADGVNSRVRTALKPDIKSFPSILTVSEKIKGGESDACEFWFGSSHAPRCYSWVFPQKEGVSAGTGAFRHAGIKSLWQAFLSRRGLKSEGSLRGYRIPLWQGDLYHLGKILFVGDAAGQVMPFTCEGIYYAMKSGELAAMAVLAGRIGDYKKLWEKRFQKRFSLMKKLWTYFLKGDDRAERIVQLHKRPEVREMSMALWLRKDLSRGSLLSYVNIFRRFLG
jgi:geranylgeranyl reductase